MTIVTLLIVIVAVTIFTGNDDEQASKEPQQSTQKEAAKTENDPNKEETEMTEATKEEVVVKEKETEKEKEVAEPGLVKVEGSDDENVLNTYESESWKPVGTEQVGTHTTSYDKGSTDWNEMTKAIAYGAGMDEADMRLWWLKNGGSENTAVGTVSAGDQSQTYRVYIEWVDGEGWKPVKMEELNENDIAKR